MASKNGKKDYGRTLETLGREMGLHSVMFHNAVAERLGLNITDHKCLDYILRQNAVSAGDLARATGLTTGAITGVIDRLEKAGFAERRPDPDDRRRVVIAPLPHRLPEVGKHFESLGRNMSRIMLRYNDHETEIICDFMRRAVEVMQLENLRLRDHGRSVAPENDSPRPSRRRNR